MSTIMGAVGAAKRAAAGLWAALWCVFRVVAAALAFICLLIIIVSLQDQLEALVVLPLVLVSLVLLAGLLAVLLIERRKPHSDLGISGVQANTSSTKPDSSTNADVNLHSASSVGDTADVQPLLSQGVAVDDSSSTASSEASVGAATARAALQAGGGGAAAEPPQQPAGHRQHASTHQLLATKHPNRHGIALYLASSEGNTAEVQRLLSEGVPVDTLVHAIGTTPLSKAVAGGHVKTTMVLLEHGADVSAQDANGYTPLALAVTNRHLGLVRLLLSKGADQNVPRADSWRSVLAHAVYTGRVDIVGLLLQAGAKGRLRPAHGVTDALEEACSTDSPAIMARLLLQYDTPASKEGLESLLWSQLRKNRYETAAQLVLQLEREEPGSTASVLSATEYDPAAFSLAMLKGWGGGSSSDAEKAAVVEQERVHAEQSTGAQELLLAYAAQAVTDKVAEEGVA